MAAEHSFRVPDGTGWLHGKRLTMAYCTDFHTRLFDEESLGEPSLMPGSVCSQLESPQRAQLGITWGITTRAGYPDELAL